MFFGLIDRRGDRRRPTGQTQTQSYCAAALITVLQTLPVQREDENMLKSTEKLCCPGGAIYLPGTNIQHTKHTQDTIHITHTITIDHGG